MEGEDASERVRVVADLERRARQRGTETGSADTQAIPPRLDLPGMGA